MSSACKGIMAIAISGQCCSGKSTLCRILAQKLNWIHADVGIEFRAAASLRGLSIEKFGSISDEVLRRIDAETSRRIFNEPFKIWDGRLTCFLARTDPRILKVYCRANVITRAKRCAERDSCTYDEAKIRVRQRDIEEAVVFRRLYGFSNPFNSQWVDLLLDTSSRSVDELSEILLRKLEIG
jgi:cytidylate kinase